MSRFEELQAAYDDFREQRTAYNDACYKFAGTFFRGFVAYSGCPTDNIKWFPPSKGFNSDDKTFYTQVGAMERGDDGFWRAGFAVLLTPKHAVLNYIINFKKVKDKFLLKLEDIDNQFEISNVEEDMTRFFEFMIRLALNNYREGLKEFLEQPRRKPIGFIAVSDDERKESIKPLAVTL